MKRGRVETVGSSHHLFGICHSQEKGMKWRVFDFLNGRPKLYCTVLLPLFTHSQNTKVLIIYNIQPTVCLGVIWSGLAGDTNNSKFFKVFIYTHFWMKCCLNIPLVNKYHRHVINTYHWLLWCMQIYPCTLLLTPQLWLLNHPEGGYASKLVPEFKRFPN